MASRITAGDVVERIRASLRATWKDSAVDGFSAGGPDTIVTGIATTFAPSLKVLKQAAAANRNMIVAREHPFYSHGRAASAPTGAMKDDAACAAKQDLIARHNLVIWRLSENWDRRPGDPQSTALAQALGWERRRIRDEFYAVPAESLEKVVSGIRDRL